MLSKWQIGTINNRARRTLGLQYTVVGISCAYVALFLIAAMCRAWYPLQLEWLEGGVFDTVGRCFHHQKIYVEPTHSYVPFLYNPLYYYLGSAACHLGGLGFAPLRLLSTACTFVCFILQALMASGISHSRTAGFLAAGYFAALYATTGFWFDIARVDMLFTALLLAGLYACWRGHTVFAAVLFALAFCTKQTAAIIAVCVLLHDLRRPLRVVQGLGTFLVLAFGITGALIWTNGPWYLYYTSYVPAHQPLYLTGALLFVARDLLYPSGLAIALVAASFVLTLRRYREKKEGFSLLSNQEYCFFFASTVGLTLACLISRVHSGGGVNVTIPLDAWLAVLYGASVMQMSRSWKESQDKDALLSPAMILGVVLLQFVILLRSPFRYIPSPAAKTEATQILDLIAHIPGDVYVFNNAADIAVVGKRSFANTDAIFDVIRADHGMVGNALKSDVEASFRRQEYSAVLTDKPLNPGHLPVGAPTNLEEFYAFSTRPAVLNREWLSDPFTLDSVHLFPRYFSFVRNSRLSRRDSSLNLDSNREKCPSC